MSPPSSAPKSPCRSPSSPLLQTWPPPPCQRTPCARTAIASPPYASSSRIAARHTAGMPLLKLLGSPDAVPDHPRHERTRDLHDVDVRVQPSRYPLHRRERLDEQPVAARNRDPVAPQQAEEPESEVAEVACCHHPSSCPAARPARRGRSRPSRPARQRRDSPSSEAPVRIAIDEAGEHLRDIPALSIGEVPYDPEVEIGDPAIGGDEQIRRVQVGVVAAVEHHLPHERRRAVDRQGRVRPPPPAPRRSAPKAASRTYAPS